MIDMLITEVNDDVRRDRIFALWRKWKKSIFTAAIALVIGTAISSGWDHYREQKAQVSMNTLAQGREAFEKGDYDAAYKAFHELSQTATGDLNDLSRLWEARSLVGQDKKPEAVTLFAALAAAPKGKDLLWRDLACLRLAGIDVSKLPTACADEKHSPLRPQRIELVAADLVEKGNIAEARVLLKKIADDEAAASTARARAQALLASLGDAKAK